LYAANIEVSVTISSTAATTSSATSSPHVAAVADNVVGLLRSFGKARARMLAAAAHDVEWSAQLVLKCIASEGPMRASEVAENLRSDPSTVSRQVAALVRDGLLERRADQADGRASVLAVTPKAEGVLAEHDQIRLAHFAEVLDGWSEADLRQFAAMLSRFTAAHEAHTAEWITERIATRSARAGGSD
jgi:DNA-binding MarR family transcriptional regulator